MKILFLSIVNGVSSKRFLFILGVSLLQSIFFYSFVYPEFYINGDNEFYRKAFNSTNEYSFKKYFLLFNQIGGSGNEPVSILLFYLFSYLVSYKVFFYIVNIFFVSSLGMLLSSLYKHWKFIFVLVVFAFYVFIVGGLTKRLTIGISFLFLSLFYGVGRKGGFFAIAALLSHFQIIVIFFAAIVLNFFLPKQKRLVKPVYIICLITIFGLVFLLHHDILIKKIMFYMGYWKAGSKNLLILSWPIMILFFCKKLKYSELSFFVVIFLCSFFIGVPRLNVVCFFACLYFMRHQDRCVIKFLMFLFPYYLYKHINYFDNYYHPGIILGG